MNVQPHARTRVVLLTGPSGCGKSSLIRRVGALRLPLDDFYRNGNEAGLPLLAGGYSDGTQTNEQASSIVDWDHPDSWDADRAMDAIRSLCQGKRITIPLYSIPHNAPIDEQDVDPTGHKLVVAEGIFAAHLVQRCRDEGLLADALCLRRPRIRTWWLRLQRDLKEHRKPVHVLLVRGIRLAMDEPGEIRRWLDLGCRPLGKKACEERLKELSR
ncbi:uridine kinase family protein [Actinomyces vulturis]|uniref:uridine kinase family protein n=1 Tax=Actinomyces vulturis TaxID=1857645 RepID=UPI000B5AC214|nr:ATP-binding protein [Actinomyces vulturis]